MLATSTSTKISCMPKTNIVTLLPTYVPSERKQKFIKFVVFYHLLAHKCPMIDYESLKDLFQLLKVKNVSKKHWIDSSRWGMVKVIHEILLEVTKVAFVVKFLSLQLLQTRLLLLTTPNDYPSTCMWSSNGRGFPSSFVYKLWLCLPPLTTFFF